MLCVASGNRPQVMHTQLRNMLVTAKTKSADRAATQKPVRVDRL
jgi:hypothetical protein